MRKIGIALLVAALATTATALHAEPLNTEEKAGAQPPAEAVFAVVGNGVITAREYQTALNAGLRQKFYHGRVPEEKLVEYKREVGQELVNRALLLAEARERGIEADERAVRETLGQYETRYGSSPQWQEMRARVLPELKQHLEQRTLIEQLEKQVRTVSEPDEQQLRDYYSSHASQFTRPEQIRLSVILLKVDPSSPNDAWEKARGEAEAILQRVQTGADFAELAREHSGDASAANGGDMGVLHRGRLGQGVHEELDKLEPGMLSTPITLLEGIAIFRLDERNPSGLSSFERVRSRAAELWKRVESQRQWEELLAKLRRSTVITIDPERFPEFSSIDPVQRVASPR